MKTILYSDVYIPLADLHYINDLEESLIQFFPDNHPNACGAIIYPENWAIYNDIIHHLIYESIILLDLPDVITEKLQDNIHINAICSGFDNTDPEYYTIDTEIQKKLQNFFDLF